jgi:RecJ-like exonuclease
MESCNICGGDGQIGNAFGGSHTTCPGCHGTGRRTEPEGIRDVTKTKPSHYRGTNQAPVQVKQTWPTTFEGANLATQVKMSASLSEETKKRLIREIMDHEGQHGTCTKTFTRKIRKQVGSTG